MKSLVFGGLAFTLISVRAAEPQKGGLVTIQTGAGSSGALWLEASLKRVFQGSSPGSTNLNLLAARNTRMAFQACFRNDRIQPLTVECQVPGTDELKPQVRFVGLVPLPHLTPETQLKELEGAGRLPGLVSNPSTQCWWT